jgi:hypothetical protein
MFVPLTIMCGSHMSIKHDTCSSLPFEELEQEEVVTPAIRHTHMTAAWGRLGVRVPPPLPSFPAHPRHCCFTALADAAEAFCRLSVYIVSGDWIVVCSMPDFSMAQILEDCSLSIVLRSGSTISCHRQPPRGSRDCSPPTIVHSGSTISGHWEHDRDLSRLQMQAGLISGLGFHVGSGVAAISSSQPFKWPRVGLWK